MQREEIAIAAFMGYEFVNIGYFGDDDETEWQRNNVDWMDKVDLTDVGDYFVNVKEDKFFEANKVAYHSSWDWLMPVYQKVAYMWTNLSAKKQADVKDIKRALQNRLILAEINGVHAFCFQFINWYNKKHNTCSPKTTFR